MNDELKTYLSISVNKFEIFLMILKILKIYINKTLNLIIYLKL